MDDKFESKIEYPVLRVTQLDTQELDEALLINIKQSINQDFFKYIQHNFFQKYHIEIFTAVKFLLWYNTYYKNSQTVGQSILDWAYKNNNQISLFKKVAHCFVYCLDEWLQEKFPDMLKKLFVLVAKIKNKRNSNTDLDDDQDNLTQRKIDKFINAIRLMLKTVSFLNYLIFLFDGKYLHAWERILNLRPAYKKEQMMRHYNHEISEREELWQTYFSLFKLIDSLVNFRKFYSKVKKNYASRLRPVEQINQTPNLRLCGICENEPTMVHCSVNMNDPNSCKHIFCYYCIRKALSDNENKYNCHLCNKLIYDIEFYITNKNLE